MTASPSLRISYVWDSDYPWDVRTAKICRTLTEQGHAVEILARNRQWSPRVESREEGTVRRMRPWRFLGRRIDQLLSFPAFFNPRWIGLLAGGVQAHRPEVVIVRDLPLALTALWVARAAGIPVVLDLAENYPAMLRDVWVAGRARPVDWLLRNPAMVAAVERYVLPRMDHILTVVEESSERVVRLGARAERVTVVSNTPPRARVAPARTSPRSGGPLVLTYLGLMEVPRGVLDVLEAVALLVREGERVELRLIGDGRDRGIFEKRAADLGLAAPVVRFLGALPNKEALRLIGEADVGLVPHHAVESWHTTIPNKLFDYMAAGLPVVTSDAVPAARVVRSAGAGLVYRSRDPEQLAACLRELQDPAIRATFASAGRAAVLDRHHWERDAAAMARALATVTARA